MEPKDPFIRKATAHKRGGAGTHADKRTKRARTRAAAKTQAKNLGFSVSAC